MADAEVIVAGAGPTGLMLAYELRLAGVDVLLLERAPERGTVESRAGGLHARTMEVLDQRGILGPFLEAGRPIQAGHFSGLWLDFTGFPSRYPYLLGILQTKVERLLEERVLPAGARLRRSAEVVGLRQDEAGVEVEVAGPDGTERLSAAYLVGCDGGRSTVRRLAGIGFPGTPATLTALLGDVELADPPEDLIFQERREGGAISVLQLEPGWYRVMTQQYDRVAGRDEPVTLDTLRQACLSIAGTDYGMHTPRWLSRFGDAARQASAYRSGRVLLAGDAAHVHFPAGGQGLNLGVQDAVNLGWKLASVVAGHTPESLLDTYHSERHPVAERVLQNTRAQTALSRVDSHTTALREVLGKLIEFDDVNRYLGEMVSALDVRYPMGAGHPLAGHRVPDADIETSSGDTRVFRLLHAGRGVLLDLTAGAEYGAAAAPWADRVDVVRATSAADRWVMPSLGAVPVPAAVLLRPDGHIAWAADAGSLPGALTRWFGPPR
ncbi:FAD-dependent oxidoreductase [Sphaerisporangium fuscum]|uniref:FAD-dependent oxidoreductase n=1 Tax=Sphaerisporangium fuscum TaxID=2835868 RepID=UPI001BDBE606|nr:FAD-dependent oxidoreductase [Sphaerisporangium fuscum]